jgi:hypothetical protein
MDGDRQCLAEAPESGLHRGTHVCRTTGPHDKHRCAVCGFGWPRAGAGPPDGQAPPFYIDRPMRGRHCRAIVPAGSVTLADMRAVCGPRTRPKIRPYLGETDEQRQAAEAGGRSTGKDEVSFGRQHTMAVATWLRQQGEVRLRAVHAPDAHCTPQCEGAWKDDEAGREHSESCTCQCGGYRHDTARPWFARHELVSEDAAGGLVYRLWKLGPLDDQRAERHLTVAGA